MAMYSNSNRKHRNQMSKEEAVWLETFVHAQKVWDSPLVVRYHAQERMNERSINVQQVADVFKSGALVEVNVVGYEVRVLFRKVFGNTAVCAVASLRDFQVVTVYANSADDNHRTLDYSQYKFRGDVRSVVRAGR